MGCQQDLKLGFLVDFSRNAHTLDLVSSGKNAFIIVETDFILVGKWIKKYD